MITENKSNNIFDSIQKSIDNNTDDGVRKNTLIRNSKLSYSKSVEMYDPRMSKQTEKFSLKHFNEKIYIQVRISHALKAIYELANKINKVVESRFIKY